MCDHRDPIYDGIGPRTSADGSSRISLNNSSNRQPAALLTNNGRHLLPYCAPIQELHECPPTPKVQQARMHPSLPKSTPNMLDLGRSTAAVAPVAAEEQSSIATSSSETTLLEENISAYCEPFGTAVPPGGDPDAKSNASRASLDNNKVAVNGNGNAFASSTPKEAAEKTSRLPSGPKTLPKPKVKPVPPPKPKKSFVGSEADASSGALISFQDESVDGSEV
jgi:hypothetical protein